MLTVYRKVEKDTNFLTGIENMNEGLNYSKPFIFSIGGNSQENFKLLQKSIVLSRIYSNDNKSGKFMFETFPVDFLSFAYEDKDNKDEIVKALFTKFFYPYLTANGTNYEDIKKQANGMNFLVFSTSGHKLFTELENLIISSLKSNNLTDDEIKDILKQISLGCVGASIKHYHNKVNSVYYVDVNDQKITNNPNYLKSRLDSEGQDNVFGGIESNFLYIFNGKGINDIENYFDTRSNLFGALAYVTSFCLENSITKKNPLTTNDIYNCLKLGKDKGNYPIDILDDMLEYSGAKKHTDYSKKLREELDSACEKLAARPKTDETVNFLLNEVRLKCSDTVYYQICAKLGLITNPNKEVMSRKTDREIISGIQELLGMVPKENNTNKTLTKNGDN